MGLPNHARSMRFNPTEPEKRLWRGLSASKLDFKFRRQAVIGSYIVDFLCPAKALIVEVDGDTHDVDADRHRDRVLRQMGYHVMHVTNADVMTNIEGVLTAIQTKAHELSNRWPHPNPSPEGEGLV